MITETIITAVTTQAIKSLVEKVIAPKFEKFIKSAKTDYKEYIDRNNPYFEEYYKRTYEKYSIINTLVFHNSQRKLKDIYVTQTLVKGNHFEDNKEAAEIDRFPRTLINNYQKILITDTAGMGKSTIMKRMFIDLIDNGFENIGIPIYIELNRLNKNRTILSEIQEELNSLSEEFDNDLLLRFIQTGGFVFFLDGYDEISIADRDEVTQDIKDFICKASTGNYFILTSRPEGSLTSFGDFQSFTIRPLKKDEAFELLRKYDVSKEKELSGNLVKLLQSGEYDSIDEFLENPLLVSLLFTAYDFNRSIPFEKHRFYGVVFEAYFEKHDNTKAMKKREKHSSLNYDGFDMVLRYIGYDCLIRTGVKFNKDTILNTIREAKEFCGISDFSENEFLEDLVSTVPLFCKEGTDYKWVHKSLLEYFAARFIFCDAKENQDDILSAIFNSSNLDRYQNMLDIYFDIDLKGFSKNITRPLLKRYLDFYRDHWIDLNIRDGLIEERIGCLFQYDNAFFITSSTIHSIDSVFSDIGIDDSILSFKSLSRTNAIFGGGGDERNRTLLRLLYRKKPSLFKKIEENNPILNNVYRCLKSCEIDVHKAFIINMRTGEHDENIYKCINSIFALLVHTAVYCSYSACKHEVERIEREIALSTNRSSLLAGI